MENQQIADVFDEIASLLELKKGNEFKVRAYRSAARTVRSHSERLEDLAAEDTDFTKLPNIGSSTADKIEQIIDSGTCDKLEDLRKSFPDGLLELMNIQNLGPAKARQLYEELDVKGLDDLKKACEDHRVQELEGLGPKTEEQILKGIEQYRKRDTSRMLYGAAVHHVEALKRFLDSVEPVSRWEMAGSFRRCKATVGDLDILVLAEDRKAATQAIVDYREVKEVLGRGKEKVSVVLHSGLQVDFRYFEENEFGAAQLYFTGSKAHNLKLRRQAQDHDWKLNEYGLFSGDRRLAGATEDSIYARFQLPWIPPELREDNGEIEAAGDDELPTLVELSQVRGDLQSHTKASDGKYSIDQMAQAAKDHGYQYFAITDHSKRVSMANGLDDDRTKAHADDIRKVDEQMNRFWLMAGIEVDILKSGKLDLEEKTLAGLDWVVGSIHYDRNLSRDQMTDRYLAAITSGVVHCLGHPLGQLIHKREPFELDLDRIFEACVEHGVFIEINAQPERLDLPAQHVRRAKEAGVQFTLGTDAHTMSDLDHMRFGVNVARRGWLAADDIVNTLSLSKFRKKVER